MSALLQTPPPRRQGAGLRSLTNKIALLFAGVVLVAFGVVYFYIVPQLRSNLEDRVLDELAVAADESSGEIQNVMATNRAGRQVDTVVRQTADDVDARISLLGVQRSADGTGFFYSIADSSVGAPGVVLEPSDGSTLDRPEEAFDPFPDDGGPDARGEQVDPSGEVLAPGAIPGLPTPDITVAVADAAVDTGTTDRGLGRSRGELIAQAAAPLRESVGTPPEWVAVYSRPIAEISEATGLIQRQVLVAGLLAVIVALAGGWLVARAVTRRVRRLESAAQEFAEGKPVKPLPIDSEDELGQLTRTFNEMQERLVRLDRSRRDFIANASHELRTPIFSLGGFAELLQDEELDPETRERFLASMREQIERLQRLSADLLDLSRLDAGALEIHPREADVAEVAKKVVQEFAPTTAARHTRLEVELPTEGVEAWCDPDRVAQIVRILLDNALRHNPPETPVTLTAARRDGTVQLAVADRGRGLEPGAAERAFERFYTADASRGSGLGLAIARELAERMGGRIALISQPGHTVFTLSLPVPGDQNGRPAAGPRDSVALVDGVPAGRA